MCVCVCAWESFFGPLLCVVCLFVSLFAAMGAGGVLGCSSSGLGRLDRRKWSGHYFMNFRWNVQSFYKYRYVCVLAPLPALVRVLLFSSSSCSVVLFSIEQTICVSVCCAVSVSVVVVVVVTSVDNITIIQSIVFYISFKFVGASILLLQVYVHEYIRVCIEYICFRFFFSLYSRSLPSFRWVTLSYSSVSPSYPHRI